MLKVFRFSHRLVLFALISYWILIAFGTHWPTQDGGKEWISDKWLHFGAFAGLAFLLAWCVMNRRPSWRVALTLIAIILCYGACDELTQNWVPRRMADLNDWVADGCGAVTGTLAYVATFRMVRGSRLAPAEAWPASTVPANDAA